MSFSLRLLCLSTSESSQPVSPSPVLASDGSFMFCLHDLSSPCPSSCLHYRRELCYFGVKVAMIEPGYFLTNMTQGDNIRENLQALWNQTSPEVKELYGDSFIADCE